MRTYTRLIIVMTVMINCLIYTVDSLAQIDSPDKWQGELYDLTAHQGPFDSVRINVFDLPLRWKDIDANKTERFLSSLTNIYDSSGLSVERILTEDYLIHRYIVGQTSGFTVLEKHSYSTGIILYFKNGIAEPEMKFYKLLTAYYEE